MKHAATLAFAGTVIVTLALGACTAVNTQVVDPLITDLSRINNTGIADLEQVEAVAQAATPPDTDGKNCAAAAITVGQEIDQVLTAAQGTNSGPLTLAELASLFQPGSIQYDQANQTLTSGCAAKAQDVLGAAGVLAAGGVVGALAVGNGILPLAAAGI